jgi:spore germination protein KA
LGEQQRARRRREGKARRPPARGRRDERAAEGATGLTAGTTQELERPDEIPISRDIAANRSRLKELLGHSDDFVQRDLSLGGKHGPDCSVFYYQAMANTDFVHTHIIEPLMVWARPSFREGTLRLTTDDITRQLLVANQIQVADTLALLFDGLFNGNVALIVDGIDRAIVVRAAGYTRRAVSEPMHETSVRGPFEGFTEDMEVNTSLVRRRYKSPHLVVENHIVGDETRTRVRLVFDQHLAPPAIVREFRRRLLKIDRDAVLYSHTIEALISDHPYALWPIIERTERPERLVGQLLQGRVALIVDGTPFALIAPATASTYFWAPDDHSESFYFSSLMRVMRVFSLVLSAFGTPAYVALVTYHPEMIPLPLLLNIALTQEGVPLPLIVIAFAMEILIEIVREAGIRLPRPIGSAVSIVGAIVVGQAAITAGFAPPGLVVVVAFSAIASFALPDYGAAVAFRLLRFPALLAGSVLGLYGVATVAMLALFDMTSIKSFGVPFLSLFTPGRGRQLLEAFLLSPPRLEAPERKLAYRDRYLRGEAPEVRGRFPLPERRALRRGGRGK